MTITIGSGSAQAVRSDLCAQIAPLDRYGLAGLSAALVDGLRALFGASRRARGRRGRLRPLLTEGGEAAARVAGWAALHSRRIGARSRAAIDRKPPIQEPSAANST